MSNSKESKHIKASAGRMIFASIPQPKSRPDFGKLLTEAKDIKKKENTK